jgi:uncharacterized protein YqgV (UPF0045/DUF77 family)
MNVQAEISLYPLRTPTLTENIGRFLEHVHSVGLHVEMGAMSSRVRGDCKTLFRALGEAFETAALDIDVVLTVKVSNACPVET